MTTSTIILVLGLLYFGAHGFAFLFQKTRVPDVLILMLIGVTIGPALGLVKPESFGGAGEVLTTVALAAILFEGGLSLRLRDLANVAAPTLLLSFTTAVATLLIISAACASLLGWPLQSALICGAILSGTSSAVVIPMVQALRPSEKASTILVLESALTDVICIILVFALLKTAAQGNFAVGNIASQIGLSLSVASLIGLIGGLVWLKLWTLVRRFPATTFTTIAFALVLYGATEMLGLSGAIATLVFGLTVTNAPNLIPKLEFPRMTDVELSFFREVVFLLKTFFFVYLGISFGFSDIGLAAMALIAVSVVLMARFWITKFALPRGATVRDAALTSALIPKGLAAAVLAGLPKQYNLAEADGIRLFVYSGVFFSIVLTAILVPLSERPSLAAFMRRFFSRYEAIEPQPQPAPQESQESQGSQEQTTSQADEPASGNG